VERLRRHPVLTTVIAFVIAAAAVVAIAAAYGFGAFAKAWTHLELGWLVLAVVGQLLAIPAYVLSYRTLVSFRGGPRLPWPLAFRIVVAGFGPSAVGGGFALDKHALHAVGDEEVAVKRVLGLGALEWALLSPAACVCAVALLIVGGSPAMPSLLWPWALLVPAGFAIGLALAQPRRRRRIEAGGGRIRSGLGTALEAVGSLVPLALGWGRCWRAWIGTALYWAFDIASFYACLRFVGLRLGVAEAVLAYATGYALTRRSMPLGGAGVTEVLMTFALHWVGVSVPAALATVVVYRMLNFMLPAGPALAIRSRVYPLVAAGSEDREPTRHERRRAAAPVRALQR
jgi:uncharacterized membrane protein YbhN (UPF0104 family)